MKKSLWLLLGLFGCAQIPAGVPVVQRFDAQRYLGTWYEIARLDHVFERGLTQVSATYSRNDDGSLNVINRGYNPQQKRWQEAQGRARFVAGDDVGQLQVSFFGPFYGGYNIIAIDTADYAYALVCGNSRDYLWILAREPQLSAAVTAALVQRAQALGFATADLIYVEQKNQRIDFYRSVRREDFYAG